MSEPKKTPFGVLHHYQTLLINDEKKTQHELCQAKPSYYVVMDSREHLVPFGYGDSPAYIMDGGDIFYSASHLMSDLYDMQRIPEDINMDKLESEFPEFIKAVNDSNGTLVHNMSDKDWEKLCYDVMVSRTFEETFGEIEQHNLREEEFIARNTLGLTYAEIAKHLDMNGHNYGPNAKPYAMTAYRNPILEEFLETFKKIDFDKSTIVFKD